MIDDILSFWFADGDGFRKEWFEVAPDFDAEIARRFGGLIDRAAAGAFDAWLDSPDGALALLLLLDQFPRNVHRGAARAFAYDAKAREVARAAVAAKRDAALAPVRRMFVYLPFEHSEDMADQERSVRLFRTLGLDDALDYAIRHRDIVARFGRFPHRNAIIGRDSTPEEIAFLQQPNSSF